MKFRYPDDPVYVSPHVLFELEQKEPGRYICQPKYDGWRKPMYKIDGAWQFRSKYDKGAQAAAIPPADLVMELNKLNLPDGTAFDAEWMGTHRQIPAKALNAMVARGEMVSPHFLSLYDLLYFNGQWQGDIPYEQRYANLKTLIALHKQKAGVGPHIRDSRIEVCPIVEVNWLNYFESQKVNPLTEGIVAKARDSKLKGGFDKPTDNPKWLKVKYRA